MAPPIAFQVGLVIVLPFNHSLTLVTWMTSCRDSLCQFVSLFPAKGCKFRQEGVAHGSLGLSFMQYWAKKGLIESTDD